MSTKDEFELTWKSWEPGTECLPEFALPASWSYEPDLQVEHRLSDVGHECPDQDLSGRPDSPPTLLSITSLIE